MSSKRIAGNKAAQRQDKKIIKFDKWYPILLLIAVAILVSYPPFFRGMFFSQDIFIFHIVTAVVLIMTWIDKFIRKEFDVIETPLDWAVLAYAGAYFFSIVGAVHYGEAVYGFMKALNYFMVYWLLNQAVRNYKDYRNILKIMYLTGIGVALIGILAATGFCNYPSAFDGKLILSTLQYKNATAAYLVVMTLIGVVLRIREENRYLQPVYLIANYLIILVVLATSSKGAWLVFAAGCLVLLLGMPGRYRIETIYYLLVSGLAAIFTAIKFLPGITGVNHSQSIIYLIIGLLVIALGELLRKLFFIARKRWGIKISTAALIIILVLSVGSGLYIAGNTLLKHFEATSLASQVTNIGDLSDFSYTSRIATYKWALAMAKDHPVIGTGAGGWNALYHKYQDYLFYETEVHSHFLQVLIDAGMLGLMSFMAMWVLLIMFIYKRWRWWRAHLHDNSTDERWLINWGTGVAALTIGIHSAIDFDLSLGAMCVLLWTLLALINAGMRLDNIYAVKPFKKLWIGIAAGLCITLIFIIAGLQMVVGNNLYASANQAYNEAVTLQDEKARNDVLKNVSILAAEAAEADSFGARYYTLQLIADSNRYAYLVKNRDPDAIDCLNSINEAIKRIQKLTPYDIKNQGVIVNAYAVTGNSDELTKKIPEIISINPMDAAVYSGGIITSINLANQHLQANQTGEAIMYFKDVVNYSQKFEEEKKKIDPARMEGPFWTGPAFALTTDANYCLGKAQFMLGDYTAAYNVLEPLIKDAKDPNIKTWYLAAVYKMGSKETALRELSGDGALFRSLINQAPLIE